MQVQLLVLTLLRGMEYAGAGADTAEGRSMQVQVLVLTLLRGMEYAGAGAGAEGRSMKV
jgi:hypothetical protein